MSCSQPWVLWQPCFGRWVSVWVDALAGLKKKKKPRKQNVSISLCLLCLHPPFPLNVFLLIQHSSVLGASPVAFAGLWYVWRSSFSSDGAKNPSLHVCCLSVAEATAGSTLDGGNIALAVFILVLLLSVLLGGAYVYVTRWAGISRPISGTESEELSFVNRFETVSEPCISFPLQGNWKMVVRLFFPSWLWNQLLLLWTTTLHDSSERTTDEAFFHATRMQNKWY